MHTQFLWIAGLETFKVVKKVQVRLGCYSILALVSTEVYENLTEEGKNIHH